MVRIKAPSEILVKLANIALKGLQSTDYPKFALQLLDEGYSSPTLYILAACDKNENPFILDSYYKQSLDEIRLFFPTEKQAIFILMHDAYSKYQRQKLELKSLLAFCESFMGVDGYHDWELYPILYRMDEAASYWSYETQRPCSEYVFPEEMIAQFEQEMESWLVNNPFVNNQV